MTSQSRFPPRFLVPLMVLFIAGIACAYWLLNRPSSIASGPRPETPTVQESTVPVTKPATKPADIAVESESSRSDSAGSEAGETILMKITDSDSEDNFGAMSPGRAAAAAEGSPSVNLSEREQRLRRFIDTNGRENVVVVRVVNSEGLRPGVLARDLIEQLGTRRMLASRPASTAIIAVRYDGEIDEVARLISWGKVTSINPDRRLIRVDAARGQSAPSD